MFRIQTRRLLVTFAIYAAVAVPAAVCASNVAAAATVTATTADSGQPTATPDIGLEWG